MGGWIRRGWLSRFWGTPIFSQEIPSLEEDKRATTNAQNGLVFFLLFSFKSLNCKKSPGGTILRRSMEKCEKSAKKCRNDFAP